MAFYLKLLCWLVACSVFGAGCAQSTLTIRHQDPTAPVAQIWVDGDLEAEVAYGDDVEVEVKPGHHAIIASVPKSKGNAWRSDRKPWVMVVDGECTLTLMTPSQRLDPDDEPTSAQP